MSRFVYVGVSRHDTHCKHCSDNDLGNVLSCYCVKFPCTTKGKTKISPKRHRIVSVVDICYVHTNALLCVVVDMLSTQW